MKPSSMRAVSDVSIFNSHQRPHSADYRDAPPHVPRLPNRVTIRYTTERKRQQSSFGYDKPKRKYIAVHCISRLVKTNTMLLVSHQRCQ